MHYFLLFISALISRLINLFSKKINNVNNILVVRLDHLGDLVCTLKVIHDIKINNPAAKLTLLTGIWNKEILQNSPYIDEILIYNSPVYTKNRLQVTLSSEKKIIKKQLKEKKIDTIISFRDDLFTIFLAFHLSPVKRFDRGTVRLDLKRKGLKGHIHETETNYLVAGKMVKERIKDVPLFTFSKAEDDWFDSFLQNKELIKNNYVIMHPGGAWKYRRWSPDKFKEVGKYINNKFALPIILLGSSDEVEIGEKIVNGTEGIFIDLIGRTTLRESILIILNCALAICNDSSIMHIASQSGVPTIGLMGPGEIEKFGPVGLYSRFYHHKLECYPCKQIDCIHPELPCVNLIETSEIMEGINILLIK